jgi:hypothetical protein
VLCFWRLSEKLGNSRAYRDFRRDLNPHYRRSQRAGLQRATYKVHGLQAAYNVLHFWTPYHRDGRGLEAKNLACKSQLVSRKWITADTSLLRHQTWCDLAPNYRNASARCGVLKENDQLDGECRRPWGHGPSRWRVLSYVHTAVASFLVSFIGAYLHWITRHCRWQHDLQQARIAVPSSRPYLLKGAYRSFCFLFLSWW